MSNSANNSSTENNQILNLPFHPAVSSWFVQTFEEPSPPQTQGWPVIADGKHSLILAPTGSGKTLAAFLWSINELFYKGLKTKKEEFAQNPQGVHTLYISPLKALNNDIHTNLQVPLNGIRAVAENLDLEPPLIRTAVRTGDTPSYVRQTMVKKPPHILITTPESLYLLLTSEKGRGILRNLSYLIVDEIHAIANNKRGVHLSLSLERLMALCKKEPVRIGLSATQKPLERIAAFLGGQTKNPKTNRFTQRSVEIVNCGQRKKLDLGVISPTPDFSNLPDSSVWAQVIDKLYELISQHKTTLVFVNVRAQAEKIARQLNEKHHKENKDFDDVIALAHHGSISREIRYDIEARLKNGQIPAVIATASLELGIDIGSIDLVVQLESPKTVTAALQRVGRSGHLLKSTSKGRIIPLYQSDLDDAVAITKCMLAGDIEETHIPENCLDVLSQQIVAEVALKEWNRYELYNLFKQSYCYRHLNEHTFNRVVAMLSGHYSDIDLRALLPRITWDKINDQLIARRGSRLLAVMNGGTIADRGYYGVYLSESNTRLGDMEEEFVFESRVGDVFYLGNNEWRIDQITRDRIIVSPLGSPKPRAPFWKGGPFFREFSTSQKIGDFRQELNEHIETGDYSKWLAKTTNADEAICANLDSYLQRQIEHTQSIPTSKQITVEFFRDAVEEPQIVVHSPFGGKVNGVWCHCLVAFLERRHSLEVQYSYNDDGLIIRLMDVVDPPPLETLFQIPSKDMEQLFINSIGDTPLFSILFRHNATRSLLLQRSRTDKRIPLWLQRLRAADLIQAVKDQKDFPIIAETYRECLEDMFDIRHFLQVNDKILKGDISLHFVETPFPSPMASDLLFRFMAEHLYQEDRMRTANHAAQVSSDLLAEILSQEAIPHIVTQQIAQDFEQRWQYLTQARKAKDKEDLFHIIAQLGPINKTGLYERSVGKSDQFLANLKNEKRIIETEIGFIAAEQSEFFKPPFDETKTKQHIVRALATRGPISLETIATITHFSAERIEPILEILLSEKEVVKGKLLVGVDLELWCDKQNFASLYSKAIVERRKSAEPINRNGFYQFLFKWHQLNNPNQSIRDLVKTYAGFYFPHSFFERELFSTRIKRENQNVYELLKEFDENITSGDIIPIAKKENDSSRTKLTFINRRDGHILLDTANLSESEKELSENTQEVFQFLKKNGASTFKDIAESTSHSRTTIENSLAELAFKSLVSCDDYPAFLAVLQPNKPNSENSTKSEWQNEIKQSWSVGHGRRGPWQRFRQSIKERVIRHNGRWFLTTTFAVMGKPVDKHKQAELQARLLLQRYGVVVKEFYRREEGLLPWYNIFQELKRMEWSGEIRRGYFITGLSGVQFALTEALEQLEQIKSDGTESSTTFVSTSDPALPIGGNISWEIKSANQTNIVITRSASNHLLFVNGNPVVYLENYGARIQTTEFFEKAHLDLIIEQLKSIMRLPANLRPRKKLELELWDGKDMNNCEFIDDFQNAGFEENDGMLVLWPSAVE
jgi:ATP-dependent helicase Lhr and Lhr-like helicase